MGKNKKASNDEELFRYSLSLDVIVVLLLTLQIALSFQRGLAA